MSQHQQLQMPAQTNNATLIESCVMKLCHSFRSFLNYSIVLVICLSGHSQSQYSDNLIKSKNFYEEWGDVTNLRFDNWWKDHKYLFQDEYVREVSRVSNNPNAITISTPLNENISNYKRSEEVS